MKKVISLITLALLQIGCFAVNVETTTNLKGHRGSVPLCPRLIVQSQEGSTSLIQRKFAIGYNRAGRLMDQLEKAGIVGAVHGSKPREVLIMDETSLENLLSELIL